MRMQDTRIPGTFDRKSTVCHQDRNGLEEIRVINQVIGGVMRGEPGEAFVRTEAARGTMFYHIVSDGEKNPYRVKISVPSFRNLIGMTHLLVGSKLADMPAIYWSLDYWPVEADR